MVTLDIKAVELAIEACNKKGGWITSFSLNINWNPEEGKTEYEYVIYVDDFHTRTCKTLEQVTEVIDLINLLNQKADWEW